MQQVLLLGDPVAHSRSPAMHNAAFARLGLDVTYRAVQTPDDQLAERVAALRDRQFLGANITLPHKQAVIPFLDELEPEAAQIGAVNTIYKRNNTTLVGANTDAPGLLADLATADWHPQGRTAIVLGASGAARAAAFGLAHAGVAALIVANRTLARAEALLADVLCTIFDDEGLPQTQHEPPEFSALAIDDPELLHRLAQADLLINATSLGWEGDATPLADPPVGPQTLVYDMVYRPTRLLREAAARGAQTRDGAGMLVQQGALAFTRWTGQTAPVEVMAAAFKSAPTTAD
jgi:shikimate dehydrogenase